MASVPSTDVFKFVALRPAQRVPLAGTRRTIIRDARAATAEGQHALTVAARELAGRAAALERWRALDLSALALLAAAHPVLADRYRQLGAGQDAPEGRTALDDAGARIRTATQQDLLRQAWDALYVADATGADAGPRLEVPIAALRVLHFAALLADDPRPSRQAALDALDATPALPTVFSDLHGQLAARARPAGAGAEPAGGQPALTSRSRQLRALAAEIADTSRLLAAVTATPALAAPAVRTGTAEPAGTWSRTQFSVSTVPSLRTLLGDGLAPASAALLDQLGIAETAPVPAAAQVLQAHLTQLGEQAGPLAGDPEFLNYLRAAKGDLLSVGELAKPSPAVAELAAQLDPSTAPDVDVAGKITPLGIGDLKVVKQTLLAYVPGEVAHIENVLSGESKERKHRRLDRSETTLFTAEEETRTTERDTQSTDRQELKREAEQTIKEDMSVKAGLTVTATLGPVVTTASGDFAYSTAKTDSTKSSSTFAREIVDRAVSKVETKTRTERTTTTLSEVEETNTHGIDNTPAGNGHLVGIYRWVDKRYRAQIYNYGVRLLLEFVVPEPAAFYRAAQIGRTLKEVKASPPPPLVNLKGTPLTVADITEQDYAVYVSRFGVAGVTPPPPLYAYSGTSIVKEGLDEAKTVAMATKEFVVPEGYTLAYYSATVSIIWTNYPQFALQVGRDPYVVLNDQSHRGKQMTTVQEGVPEQVLYAVGPVPVSVASYDVLAFAVNVQGIAKRDDAAALAKWKLQTYDKIVAAHQGQQAAYDQQTAQAEAAAGVAIDGHNPALNRAIEQTELKKLCITMMTGQHFSRFQAMTDPADKPAHYPEVDVQRAFEDGPIAQFFEQAFEWEQMTYLFFPYFWGRKRNWVENTRQSDPDPLFAQFLTAGAARVVVPVPLAYKDSVQYLLQSTDPDLRQRVWRGGPRPTLDSDLYVSIAQEMRSSTDDLADAVPDGPAWEFTLPTTLVWLQPDPVLPTFE